MLSNFRMVALFYSNLIVVDILIFTKLRETRCELCFQATRKARFAKTRDSLAPIIICCISDIYELPLNKVL